MSALKKLANNPGPNCPGPNYPGPNCPGSNCPGPNCPRIIYIIRILSLNTYTKIYVKNTVKPINSVRAFVHTFGNTAHPIPNCKPT